MQSKQGENAELRVLLIIIVAGIFLVAATSYILDHKQAIFSWFEKETMPAQPGYDIFREIDAEKRAARDRGMTVDQYRQWLANNEIADARSDRQSLYIGGGIVMAGLFIGCALFFSRRKRG